MLPSPYYPVQPSHPRKNFSIKKHIKLISLPLTVPITPTHLPLHLPPPAPSPSFSQPVSPFKLSLDQIPSNPRNISKFFDDILLKNTINLQQRHYLPSIQYEYERFNEKKCESPGVEGNKYGLLVKESKSSELGLREFLQEEGVERREIETERKGEKEKQTKGRLSRKIQANTMQLDHEKQQNKNLRIKPLMIQNRLMAKFGMLKKRSQVSSANQNVNVIGTGQNGNSIKKYINKKPFKTEEEGENPELFTFYPRNGGEERVNFK